MPKKFKGENSKAQEARARKAAQSNEVAERKQKELEDEYWKDDDKHMARKQQRKEDKDKKRQELLEKKHEAQRLLEEETAALKVAKPLPPSKVTRAEIEANTAKQAAEAASAAVKEAKMLHDETPLEENINRVEGAEGDARTVEEALSVLSTQDPSLDKHPEKRVKAAFAAYEEVNLPRMKAENPNMRLSQLKQMLKKEWQKSPLNPLNQRFKSYNDK